MRVGTLLRSCSSPCIPLTPPWTFPCFFSPLYGDFCHRRFDAGLYVPLAMLSVAGLTAIQSRQICARVREVVCSSVNLVYQHSLTFLFYEIAADTIAFCRDLLLNILPLDTIKPSRLSVTRAWAAPSYWNVPIGMRYRIDDNAWIHGSVRHEYR